MSELNWHLPAAHFHRCFSTLQSLTNWWAHFSSICFSSSSEHEDTEDTEHEFPACFYSRELSLENKRKKKSWGFTSEWAAGDLRCIYVCSLLFLCFIFEEKNKPRRDQSHIWVNQMSSRAATYVAVCFWRFLSAVIGVFLSFFFFSIVASGRNSSRGHLSLWPRAQGHSSGWDARCYWVFWMKLVC